MASSNLSWEYIAGFFDGEGSIQCCRYPSKRGLHCLLSLPQLESNGEVLSRIKKAWAKEGVWVRDYIDSRPSNRNIRVLRVYKQDDIEYVLKKMLPHLVVKKQAAKDALKMLRDYQRGAA
jgi:hypothetical protein